MKCPMLGILSGYRAQLAEDTNDQESGCTTFGGKGCGGSQGWPRVGVTATEGARVVP